MTEEEWPACCGPKKKLIELQGRATERKLRLFTSHSGQTTPLPHLPHRTARFVLPIYSPESHCLATGNHRRAVCHLGGLTPRRSPYFSITSSE